MAEIVKETITSQSEVPVEKVTTQTSSPATSFQTIEYFIYFLFGTIDFLLLSRFILKLTGASTSSNFVNSIYGISRIFVYPFEGIFSKATTQGLETTAVFEPAVIVAIVVYMVIAWGVVTLIRISSGEKQEN